MLERHWCDCGYEFSRERDPGSFRWQCPQCNRIYTILAGPDPADKTLGVFQEAIRRLERLDADGAVQAAAQFYELWVKSIVRVRDRQWFEAHPLVQVNDVLRHLERIYKLPEKTLCGITSTPRNLITHDLKYTMKTAEAVTYVDGVVAATWDTLTSLIGEDVWKRGEAGELNHLDMDSSDEHLVDVFKYDQHYRLGIVGPVMWGRTWWAAYRSGRTDWYKVQWTGSGTTDTGSGLSL